MSKIPPDKADKKSQKNVKVLLWQECDMVSAGAAVQEKKLSQRAAAKEFSVPRFTLPMQGPKIMKMMSTKNIPAKHKGPLY